MQNDGRPAGENANSPDRLDAAQYIEANRHYWHSLISNHLDSKFYNVEAFLRGASTLHDLELSEVGDVTGANLLHLYCHFGLDTLSWARNGAHVTGIDFSEPAIQAADDLAHKAHIPARFICADAAEAARYLDQTFDIIYASYGVVRWITDLSLWARLAFKLTKPGGKLYLLDFHPLLSVIRGIEPFKTNGSYFENGRPFRHIRGVDYADRAKPISAPSYEWRHTLGDIVTAIADSGYQVNYLHEHPESPEQSPALQPTGTGYWAAPGACLPTLFSIHATRITTEPSPRDDEHPQRTSEHRP